MAAMMFPAITPMVLLYNRLIKRSDSSRNDDDDNAVDKGLASSQSSVFVEPGDDDDNKAVRRAKRSSLSLSLSLPLLPIFTSSVKIIFFVGSYLLVWTITGIVLLLTWYIRVNYFFMHFETGQQQQQQQQQHA
jgi:hypothetical protein